MEGALNVEGFQQYNNTDGQPIQDANRCLTLIVDTLRRIDPGIISVGTLQYLQSNILYVATIIQYSSGPLPSIEPILAYLEQGHAYLAQISSEEERSRSSDLLEQSILSFAKAMEQWKSQSSVDSSRLNAMSM